MFATMIQDAINGSGKLQREIAEDLGYNNPNIMVMFKQGKTRVPINKVTLLATSLGEDPVKWLRAWFESYEPEALADIEKHLGFPLTRREKSWVLGLRKVFGDKIPTFDPKKIGDIS